MPSDIKERVVARNVKTLDRAALLKRRRGQRCASEKQRRQTRTHANEGAMKPKAAGRRRARRIRANGARGLRGHSERCAGRPNRRRNVPGTRARPSRPQSAANVARRGAARHPAGQAANIEPFAEGAPAGERARLKPCARGAQAARAHARPEHPAKLRRRKRRARRAASSAGGSRAYRAPKRGQATAALTGLGSSAAAVVVVTCLAAFVATSAFASSLMGRRHRRRQPPPREVAEIGAEHAAQGGGQGVGGMRRVSVSGGKSPWKRNLAVFAVKLAADAENPPDVLTPRRRAQGALRAVFWDMNSIETEMRKPSRRFRRRRRPPPGAARHALGQDGGADGVDLRGSTQGKASASFWTSATTPQAGRTHGSRAAPPTSWRSPRAQRATWAAGRTGRSYRFGRVEMVRVLRELVCRRVRVHRFGRGAQVLLLPHGRAVVQGRRPLAARRQRAGAWGHRVLRLGRRRRLRPREAS